MNLGLGPFWNSARDVAFVPGNTIGEVIKHAIDAIEAIDAIDAIIK